MRNDNLLREIEQFFYREARLLDSRRFHESIRTQVGDAVRVEHISTEQDLQSI